ncbi:N-acetylglucosamine kinase [Alkalicoccus daliensis]|uniref:BadF-type ATPase n=1 Tax=Alkalicoccus daliensis TaxID=745820 RepID=A0A1H0E1Q4_9BACI|nr:BadF/BadG/BcrA/BcrD ATPase family protein [Alkalicoccus daliensis]SDN76216.1 BadF-type ATPase [Alkalicoccus daliensis]
MSYVVGIDGGGTKTTCLFNKPGSFSYPGSDSAFIVTGEGTNPQSVGFKTMKERLRRLLSNGLSTFNITAGDISAVSCGIAGLGSSQDIKHTEKIIKEIFLELDFSENLFLSVHSDSFIALYGAIPEDKEEGILVISGTGSNSLGIINSGEFFRSGGWGHFLGDEGSGYQIGMHALQHLTKAFDKRGAPTLLTEKILNFMNWDHLMEVRNFVYQHKADKKEIAAFAKLVIEASEERDEVAVRILKKAAEELVLHVESLHLQSGDFHKDTPVMTAGSIFENSAVVMNYFQQQIHSRDLGVISPARSTPVYGACLLAEQLLKDNRKVR